MTQAHEDVVVTIDERGIATTMSHSDARRRAEALIARIEQLNSRDTPIGASDQRTIRMLYEQAADLLRQTGDTKALSGPTDLSRFYAPGGSERILAQRDQLRREAATVTRAGALLGAKWSDATRRTSHSGGSTSQPSASGLQPSASVDTSSASVDTPSESVDKVRLVLDKATSEWVLSGKGATTRYKNYDLAEAAARRRAGFK